MTQTFKPIGNDYGSVDGYNGYNGYNGDGFGHETVNTTDRIRS